MAIIFLDECGFTGEDLFNGAQPIFVLSSTNLSEEICRELLTKHFSQVKSEELKHTKLSSYPKQQNMAIEFIKDLGENYKESVKFSVAHKRFILVTKIVDTLIETLAHEDGINLYERGANIGYSNMLFFITRSIVSETFFNEMILNFQKMMRERTEESYDNFFRIFFENEFPKPVDDLFVMLKAAHIRLGYPFIKSLPENALDIALTDALVLINEWKSTLHEDENITLIHDRSSNMAKEKEFWDILVNPNIPQKVVGFDRRKMSFPLKVEKTDFSDSKDYAGLQFVDILAGAIAKYFRWIIEGQNKEDEYGLKLFNVMPSWFGGHVIWPTPEVTPDGLQTTGEDADDPIEFINELRKEHLNNC